MEEREREREIERERERRRRYINGLNDMTCKKRLESLIQHTRTFTRANFGQLNKSSRSFVFWLSNIASSGEKNSFKWNAIHIVTLKTNLISVSSITIQCFTSLNQFYLNKLILSISVSVTVLV